MDHWPDIDRCRALKKAKYPQGKTIFNYVCIGESWIIDLTKKGDGLQRCAAPIVTELEAEIKKLNPPKREDEAWIDIDIMADGTVYAGIPELLEECEYHQADTIPNVLTDLWLWLKGREK